MTVNRPSLHVTLVATPDAQVSPLSGLYETLNAFPLLAEFEPDLPAHPFEVEIVRPAGDCVLGASGLPLGADYPFHRVDHTDIVIVPLMMVRDSGWVTGRYPELVAWLRKMHDQGALLCSACTGVLLMAETGLLDGHEATIHWAFAPTFRRNFPKVCLCSEEVLIVAGDHAEFVMSGGVMSWHDLALYLVARYVGPTAAQTMARILMLQWHADGQAPYIDFSPSLHHGDALVLRLQKWLSSRYRAAHPVDMLIERSGLPRRTFERRFRKATGHSPIAYVQHLRVTAARRELERTDTPVTEVSCNVGYENTAFFRRIFKRLTRVGPGAYRRKFQPPVNASASRPPRSA